MFGWLKKKRTDKPNNDCEVEKEPVEVIERRIKDTLIQINEYHDETSTASLHEKVGTDYCKLDQVDKAIEHLEKSLELKPSMGEGYKKLMMLYNKKRAEAARNRDDALIDYYMGKLDEMRNLAKIMTLTR